MTERLDLPRRYRDQVEALLREHVPGVEVWAYGAALVAEATRAVTWTWCSEGRT